MYVCMYVCMYVYPDSSLCPLVGKLRKRYLQSLHLICKRKLKSRDGTWGELGLQQITKARNLDAALSDSDVHWLGSNWLDLGRSVR